LRPLSYRGCWHRVSRRLFLRYRQNSSLRKEVYVANHFILHAVLLRQAFAHCGRFLTAASRRSGHRVSVALWLVDLSIQLPVIALVGRYPANKLIGRRPFSKRLATLILRYHGVLANLSTGYLPLRGRFQRVTHPFAADVLLHPHDLHVLCTPPALILSQDQTLHYRQSRFSDFAEKPVRLLNVFLKFCGLPHYVLISNKFLG